MKPEDILIACSNDPNPLKHIEVKCNDCDGDITLSDSTLHSIRLYPERDLVKYPPTLVCLECFFKSHYKPEKISPISQIQKDDISSVID